MRRRRWLLRGTILCGALGALAVGAWLVAHAYLAHQIRSQLASFHEGRITIGQTRLGLDQQHAEEITLWDEATGEAWVTIERADFQLSLWDALRGQTRPDSITLRNLNAQLRLDAQGRVLNRLPELVSDAGSVALPADRVRVLDAELAVQQTGREPLIVPNMNAELEQQDAHIRLRGEVPFWDASWSFGADVHRQSGEVSGSLSAGDVTVDSRSVAGLPLVPRGALQGVEFAVRTPVELNGSWQPGETLRYQLRLEPSTYRLTVAGKPWTLAGSGGSVVAEDGMVTADGLSANLWNGRVLASGRMDARRLPWQGRATVALEGIEVAELPLDRALARGDWPQLHGTIFGRSEWEWELDEATRTVRGTGSGQVREPRVDGLQAEPIDVEFELKQVAAADADWSDRGELSGQATAELRVADAELQRVARLLDRWVDTKPIDGLTGRVSLASSVQLPLDTVTDPLSYGAQGEIEFSELAMREVSLRSATASWNLDAGRLTVPKFEVRLDEQGGIEGNVAVDLKGDDPRLEATAQFDAVPVHLAGVVSALVPRSLEGRVAGGLTATAPWRRWNELAVWEASGHVAADRLRLPDQDLAIGRLDSRLRVENGVLAAETLKAAEILYSGVTLRDASGRLRLDAETLEAEDLRASWNDSVLGGEFQLAVAEPHTFRAALYARDVDTQEAISLARQPAVQSQLDRLRQALTPQADSPLSLPPPADWPLRGRFTIDTQVRGSLSPFSAEAGGTVSSPKLAWDGVPALSAERLTANWQLDPQRLALREAGLEILGGQVRFEAELPWAGDDAASVQGEFSSIDAQRLSSQLVNELPVSVAGELSGSFSIQHPLQVDRRTASLQFAGLDVTAQEQTLRGVRGTLKYRQGELDIQSAATFQQAPVRFSGKALLDEVPWNPVSVSGRVELADLDLARLRSALPSSALPRDLPSSLRGAVSAQLEVAVKAPDWQPSGEGRVNVRDLAWDTTRLSEPVQARVSLRGGMLEVDDLAARLAGGDVRAGISLDLRGRRRGTFTLRADRLDLATLARPWRRELPSTSGRLSLAMRGSLGQQWRAAGTVTLDNGELAGIPFELRRASFDGTFIPRNGNLQTQLQLSSAALASGRLTGKLEARWAGRLDLEGDLQLRRARVRELARATDQLRNRLSGRLDGQVDFQGTRIESLDSFQGTYDLRLFQSQTLSLPVLDALADSLGISSPASETFGETVASGSFRRGILSVERMTMESPRTKLYVDGTITRRGRLDLDVTADTAQLAAAGVALGFLRPLDFLRRRLLFLHVGGSIRSPIVQPRTAELIEQELVLFFLPLATPAPVTP